MAKTKPTTKTPLMRQYHNLKKKHPNAILLFRVGDFYETFEEDAHKLHKITNVKLTKRANGSASHIALAGFPYHALDTYLPKIIQAGHPVAIANQTTVPQKGKEIVERAITEVVTPGTTYHDHTLVSTQNNYLASLHLTTKDTQGIALIDITTGEFIATEGPIAQVKRLIQQYQPAEIIYNQAQQSLYFQHIPPKIHNHTIPEWVYTTTYAYRRLTQHFRTNTLKGYGIQDQPAAIIAAAAILHYLDKNQHDKLDHINAIARLEEEHYIWLDPFTIRNLELINPYDEEGTSLLQILDKTTTPMGARNIRKWLLRPLKQLNAIQHRQNHVEALHNDDTLIKAFQHHLNPISDIERLLAKVTTQRINPRELQTLKKSLQQVDIIRTHLSQSSNPTLQSLHKKLHPNKEVVRLIHDTIQQEPPLLLHKGNIIKPHISPALDTLRETVRKGHQQLEAIKEQERLSTNITSLKVDYNKVHGYYLEVTKAHLSKVPNTWTKRQGLINTHRYITPEIKSCEEQILEAQEKIQAEEEALYQLLLTKIAQHRRTIQSNAQTISHLDTYHALAKVAKANNYVKPTVTADHAIIIEAGRHPVIEATLPIGKSYIPNDTTLDEDQQILLITGPNMAGKSALLRQVALIVLMSHIGSFVPATKATIGLTKKIFIRVGATDNITRQESTFMVEMNEMATILNNLSDRTLIIVDELGRGTGTLDGLAISSSVVTYLHNHPQYRPKVLFATHYHQLDQLADKLPRVKNYKVLVKEIDHQICFLHKLQPGSTQDSFGIQVAQMAGIPKPIIAHAFNTIQKLREKQHTQEMSNLIKDMPHPLQQEQKLAQTRQQHIVIQALDKVDLDRITPLEALMKLRELKEYIPS